MPRFFAHNTEAGTLLADCPAAAKAARDRAARAARCLPQRMQLRCTYRRLEPPDKVVAGERAVTGATVTRASWSRRCWRRSRATTADGRGRSGG